MNTDLTVRSGELATRSTSVFDGNVQEFKGALARRGENRKSLIDWIREALVEGVDYGKIHTKKKSECQHKGPPGCTPEKEPYHWSKDSLRKPGAEKICGMLGVNATFPTIKDYEQSALNGVAIETIILRCHLLSADGAIIADGIGARSVQSDYGDLNKALKMACKSAHIDATLRMAGLSEIFTQDIEDMPKFASDGDTSETSRPLSTTDQDPQQQPQQRKYTATHDTGPAPVPGSHRRGYASDKQVKLINYRADLANIPMLEVLQAFRIPNITDIPFAAVNDILAWIAERTDAD